MTVLQVIPSFHGGGVERGTLDFAAYLVQHGYGSMIVSSGGEMVKQAEIEGIKHVTLPLQSKNPWKIYQNITHLEKIISHYKVDLIHARSRAPAWSALYAAQHTGIPFITTVHGAYSCPHYYKKLYNSIMVRSDRIIATSEYMKSYIEKHYQKWYSKDDLTVIPRGVDHRVFDPKAITEDRLKNLRQKWDIPDHKKIILHPGRLTRSKGHLVLLEAIKALQCPDVTTLIIGSDRDHHSYRQEIEEKIRRYGLQQQVKIYPHCDDMPAAYLMATAVVNPSQVPESFGRVIIEAQSMGVPVIATPLGAPVDLIDHEKTGWFAEVKDIQSWHDRLKEVVNLPPDQRQLYQIQARQKILDHFTNEKMCAAILETYHQVLSG